MPRDTVAVHLPSQTRLAVWRVQTNIREEVTVDHAGNHYSGVVTIDQYDPSGMHVLFELKGTVSAVRITAD
jgi:hypothetical protein